MKKFLSILTVMLVVAAMLHISVARHYCGGKLVASRISLSGEPATCGMEGEEGNCGHDHNGDQIKSHCCDDVIISYSIDNNYTSAFKTLAGFQLMKFQTPVIPSEKPVKIAFIVNRFWSDVSPPGECLTSSVELPKIRVFRI